MMDSESSGEAATDDDDGDGASELSESCGVVAGCRQRPDVACLDHERKLQRVATTGGGGKPFKLRDDTHSYDI